MHLRTGVFATVFCCWLLASPSSAVAQQPRATATSKAAVSERPTLGLVLEGGGALGLAHIGVIQWMEENRIPVNYIAGTSMGGLVGGVAGRKRILIIWDWDEMAMASEGESMTELTRK